MNVPRTPLVLGALAVVLLAGAGAAPAAAAGDQGGQDEVRIVDEEIRITDGLITISDTTLRGPGLPDGEIDRQRYTVEESTLQFDGFHVTVDGTRYTFCRIVVTVDDVGLQIADVRLENTG